VRALFILFILSGSLKALALTGRPVKETKISTPRGPGAPSGQHEEYNALYQDLDTIGGENSLNCNQTYKSSAHAMVCNCANESGNQSLKGMTAVSRVVLSRLKSPDYPQTILGVVCQRSQFSWTIGGWNSKCQRLRATPTYFNTKRVTGLMLKKCVRSAQDAAALELVSNPTELYALNYCSNNPRAYRNAIPTWCRTLINTATPIGGHVFGFANRGQRRAVPARGSAPSSISWLDYFRSQSFFISKAFASFSDDPKIINTRSKKQVIYGEKIQKTLQKKYKNFKPYSFKDFDKPVQNLLKATRDNLPAATTGDYNGDGEKDLIVMGRDKNKHVVLAFLSHKNNFKDFVVSSEPVYTKPIDTYLVNISKKSILFNNKKSQDAFQVETFGGAAIAKLFDGRKFVDNNKKNGFTFKK